MSLLNQIPYQSITITRTSTSTAYLLILGLYQGCFQIPFSSPGYKGPLFFYFPAVGYIKTCKQSLPALLEKPRKNDYFLDIVRNV